MQNTARIEKKANHARRHAEESAADGLWYAITLGAFFTGRDLDGLSWRAERLLTALATLYRGGEAGYVGAKMCLAALGAFCERVVGGGGMSTRTVQRAVAELRAAGWVNVSHYGGGAPRETSPGRWVRDQRVVLTLSDSALDRLSRPAGRPMSYHCAPKPKGRGMDLTSVPSSLGLDEKRETPARAHEDDTTTTGPAPSVSAEVAKRTVDSGPSTGPLEEIEPLKGSKVSVSRPWVRARAARQLLNTLAIVLEPHRDGETLWTCLQRTLDARSSGPVDWEWWLRRWPEMTEAERRRVARAEFVPALRRWSEPPRVGVELYPPRGDVAGAGLGFPPGGLPAPSADGSARASAEDARAALVAAAAAGNSFARALLVRRCGEPGLCAGVEVGTTEPGGYQGGDDPCAGVGNEPRREDGAPLTSRRKPGQQAGRDAD
jgi:hypothetical protein